MVISIWTSSYQKDNQENSVEQNGGVIFLLNEVDVPPALKTISIRTNSIKFLWNGK